VTLGVGDVRLPARQVMVNVTQALAGAGASPIYVLKTAIDVAGSDRRDLHTVWGEVRDG